MASRPRWRVHSGQIVAAQVSVALIVVTAGHPGGVLAAGLLLAVAFGRRRGRWLYQWVRPVAGLALRRRTVTAGASAADLLALARPGVRLDEAGLRARPALVLADRHGEVAVLDVGEPGVLAEPLRMPPSSGSPELVQVLVTARRAPAASDAATTSYHELAGGGTLTMRRVLLAVRVRPGDDLAEAVRAACRRLAPLPVQALPAAGLDRTLAQLGVTAPVRERFVAVRTGELAQVSYRLPAAAVEWLPRLLALPVVATTVSVTGDAVFVRVACRSEEDRRAAETVLDTLRAGRTGTAYRLDGEHLPGVAATLPLAVAGAAIDGAGGAVTVSPAGVMLGRDPAGRALLAALFGPQPARVVLIGDLHLAQLLAWRGLGAGARVAVHTGRPEAWRALARAAGSAPLRVSSWTGDPLAQDPVTAGQVWRPALRLVDGVDVLDGAAAARWLGDGADGAAHVVVRPRVTAADANLLSRAGLVLTRALDERESTLVTAALGLGRAGAMLRRADPGRVYAIGGGAVTEVRTSLTAVEKELVGAAPVDDVTR